MIFGPPAPPLVYLPPVAPFVCPYKRTHYGCVPTRNRPRITVQVGEAVTIVRIGYTTNPVAPKRPFKWSNVS